MMQNSLKHNIAKIRNSKKISQSEMANRIGVTRNAYRDIEKGDTQLISERLYSISQALDVPLKELIFGPDSAEQTEFKRLKDMCEQASREKEDLRREIDDLRERLHTMTQLAESRLQSLDLLLARR